MRTIIENPDLVIKMSEAVQFKLCLIVWALAFWWGAGSVAKELVQSDRRWVEAIGWVLAWAAILTWIVLLVYLAWSRTS